MKGRLKFDRAAFFFAFVIGLVVACCGAAEKMEPGHLQLTSSAFVEGGTIPQLKLYALDKLLELKPGATKKEVERAMEKHIVGQGQLIGTYNRK